MFGSLLILDCPLNFAMVLSEEEMPLVVHNYSELVPFIRGIIIQVCCSGCDLFFCELKATILNKSKLISVSFNKRKSGHSFK